MKKISILNGIFVSSLLIANIIASKIIQIGPFIIPAAVIAYPITFLMTDIIGELYGKEEANKTVKLGLICQILSIVLIMIAVAIPPASFADNQSEFKAILGASARVTIASLIAYYLSQSWDVWAFHKLRDKYLRNHGTTKGGKWIWNNGSTMTSQIIDTAIFITIAFYGKVPNIWVMIFSQYIVKFILALLDTPFFYYFTRESKADGKFVSID